MAFALGIFVGLTPFYLLQTILAIYFGFIAIIAFAPALLGTPLAGGVTTLGIPVGLAVIVVPPGKPQRLDNFVGNSKGPC